MSRALAKKELTSLSQSTRRAATRQCGSKRAHRVFRSAPTSAASTSSRSGYISPTPDEIKRMVHAASGNKWRPFLVTAIFTGLRASELRGLPWRDVDLTRGELHVRQRADRYNAIGKLKSEIGRTLGPAWSARAQYVEGVEARLSEGRTRARVPVHARQHHSPREHHQERVNSGADCRGCGKERQGQTPACTA